MTDVFGMLRRMKRPGLLIRAARNGADQYNRNEHLARLLEIEALPRSGLGLIQLIEIERDLNLQRQSDRCRYSCARHVEVLIVIMGEARLLRASLPDLTAVQPIASGTEAFLSAT
ncbi:DUF6477 family protein [Thalassovita aquimarina]|uniref:DUF6477 family protein n=1 Tax=Thalassovita aquimarina TaxID=2785917 RepID=UPI0035649BEB